jgi:hypothetical protein
MRLQRQPRLFVLLRATPCQAFHSHSDVFTLTGVRSISAYLPHMRNLRRKLVLLAVAFLLPSQVFALTAVRCMSAQEVAGGAIEHASDSDGINCGSAGADMLRHDGESSHHKSSPLDCSTAALCVKAPGIATNSYSGNTTRHHDVLVAAPRTLVSAAASGPESPPPRTSTPI